VEVGSGVGGTLVFVAVGREVSVGGRVAGKTEVWVGKAINGVCVACKAGLGKLHPTSNIPSKLTRKSETNNFGKRILPPYYYKKTIAKNTFHLNSKKGHGKG